MALSVRAGQQTPCAQITAEGDSLEHTAHSAPRADASAVLRGWGRNRLAEPAQRRQRAHALGTAGVT